MTPIDALNAAAKAINQVENHSDRLRIISALAALFPAEERNAQAKTDLPNQTAIRTRDERMVVTIQIGNSDDKLTQKEWSCFIAEVDGLVGEEAAEVHFSGGSSYDTIWQNACWVVLVRERKVKQFKSHLARIRKRYRQDSVAVACGTLEMI